MGRSLDHLLPRLHDCLVLTIEIPIGLPDEGYREADRLAATRLGPRRSSVFPTPPRAVLEAATHGGANEVARRILGKGVSLQAYGLRGRIFEAEHHVRAGVNLVEVHPEVSFAELAGAPLAWSQSSWRGAPMRRKLLLDAGIRLPDILGEADGVPIADVLDAAAAAWSADRIAEGAAVSLPDPPSVHSDGIPAAIHA